MHSFWVLLLFISPATTNFLSLSLTYPEALEDAIRLYNEEEGVKFLYRLVRAEPRPDWDPEAEEVQSLKFSMKETVCPAIQDLDFSKCDFKEDGDVKVCSGSYKYQKKPQMNHIDVVCYW
ncbi:cathelicidin-related peptide Oh-Cath-like [Liasis olivaceus]